jgi:hypothetical protein
MWIGGEWLEEMLVSIAKAEQDWAFVELCYRNSWRSLFALYRYYKE